jgi:hypothetical protein
MTNHPDRGLHPIRILHVLGCLGLAAGFGLYGWTRHPIRQVPGPRLHQVGRNPAGLMGPSLARELNRRLALAQVVLPDLLGGLSVLALFALGTGVYARRVEVWLEAHRAGEAASIRGVGLDRAALGANKDRRKGAAL